MVCVWRRLPSVSLSVEYIGPRTEKPRKTKIDIIGLSLLCNDVDCDCRHLTSKARRSDGRAPDRAGTGRILGLWAFAVDRSLAGLGR